MHDLTQLFDSHNGNFLLKRSLLVTWDEAKLRNLIFIGASSENSSIRVIPATTDFTMMSADTYAGILNQHPKPGEPAQWTRLEYPLTRDYAVTALQPGVEAGHRTLVFSGLTTMGTQAAVEFASDPARMSQLLSALNYKGGELRPFEAVLEVTLGGGVPLQSKIVAVRSH